MSGAEQERARLVAQELREAKLRAIKDADKSGCLPTVAAIVAYAGVQLAFGYSAAFWAAAGSMTAIIVFLWESGRNSEIEQRATEQWAAKFLARGEHFKEDDV